MHSPDEVLSFEKPGSPQIEDITVVSSNLSDRYWAMVEALGEEILFSNTDVINLANWIDDFKERAASAALHLTDEELEEWIEQHEKELDDLIQAAARLLSSYGLRPFAFDFHEWNVRLREEEIAELEAEEHFDALVLETLSEVVKVSGLLPDKLREEASILVEEVNRICEWEEALNPITSKLRERKCDARDVSDLLGYVAQCAKDHCRGNLKSLLRMIDFDLQDFLNLAEACDDGKLNGSAPEVQEELLTDFSHFLERMRIQFLHRLREMWKIPQAQGEESTS